MAVKSANGFIPEIWEAAIQRAYESNLVAKKLVWDKSGSIKYGDIIHFTGLSDPTITGSYAGSTLSYETLIDSQVNLLVNQQNTFSFIVDDLEDAMANVDLKGSQANRAGYMLAKTMDAYVLGATTAGKALNTITDTSLDSTTVLGVISQASRLLADNDVPSGEKWCVISPWVQEKLILAGVVHNINEGISGQGGKAWAKYLDLDLYVTTNISNATNTSAVTGCLAGSYRAIGYAESILKTEMLRDKDAFGYYARGLMVYGTEVVFPNELVNLQLTYAAESAI